MGESAHQNAVADVQPRGGAAPAANVDPRGGAARTQAKEINEATQPILYTVQGGDTLWDIAHAQLGEGARYPEILALNTEKDLEPLQVGVKLRIPATNEASRGSVDVDANWAQHPAGHTLNTKLLVAAIKSVSQGKTVGEGLASAARDTLMQLDDGNFAAVLNALQTLGWLDDLLTALPEDAGDAIIERAEVALTINVTTFHDADIAAVEADFTKANEVYNPHGISVEQGNRVDLDQAETQAILGQDERLDVAEFNHMQNGMYQPQQETQQLLQNNHTSGRLTAYWIKDFTNLAGLRGIALAQFAVTLMDEAVVVSTDTRAEDTFAHELGHVLTQTGHNDADAARSALNNDNLMQSGSSRNVGVGELTDVQVETIKQSIYARFRG